MGLRSELAGKRRRERNRTRRPAAVLRAQRRHLAANRVCAACGSRKKVQAHHVRPFEAFPELGAEPSNFVSLCEGEGVPDCHVRIGHGGSFKHWDPEVLSHVTAYRLAETEEERAAVRRAARDARLPNTKRR